MKPMSLAMYFLAVITIYNTTSIDFWHYFFFFQSSLVCSFPLDALPCEEAPAFYEGPDSINARFGLVEDYEA